MYAQLCKRLSDEAPNFESQKPQIPGQESLSTFRLLLLNKCKIEFENRAKTNEAFESRDDLGPEDEERRQLAKRKMLGNIKFIGELGKLEIVSCAILHRCILQLLSNSKKRAKGPREENNMAEDIECLCQIMRTCGRILDSDEGRGLMAQYFSRMSSLAERPDLPLRIRFMLRDVIELRRDGWVPRKATSTEGPMPINQIRNDNDDNTSRNTGGYHNNRRTEDRLGGSDFLRKITRPGIDIDIVGSGMQLSSPAPFGMPPHFNPNGFSSQSNSNYGRHNQRNQSGGGGGGGGGGGYYHQNQNQNRHQNNYQSKHNHHQQQQQQQQHQHQQQHQQQHHQQQHHNSPQNYNNNGSGGGGGGAGAGNKDQIRFYKSKMLISHPEEVSLRPPTSAMMFKQANIKPATLPLNDDLFTGRNTESPLLRTSTIKSVPPMMHKEQPPAIVIKQVDKRDKARDRKDKGPTREEIVKKVNTMMDEFSSETNVNDALTIFKDLKIPDRFLRHAVYTIFSNTLERGDVEREFAVKFISEMKKETIINSVQLSDGWKELVTSISDKESTIPCVASHVASIIAKSIVSGLMQLQDLASVTENGQHHPLFLLTLQSLAKTQGKAALTQIFNDSKVNLMSQLPEAEKTKERLGEILEIRELTFLYPLLRIQGDMWKQLESDPSPNTFYKWIKDKLDPAHYTDPGFINALMTVLLKYITQETTLAPGSDPTVQPEKPLQEKERALLQKYTHVLESFLTTIDAQVTAVHSLQVFCLSHDFPKGMLLRWFVALYDFSIVDEDAFLKWKEDVTDAYPGKGKALFQVNGWLTWLADASSEEEEDEGDN